MKLYERQNFWPWACGIITCGALTLGLAAEGAADIIAASLLFVPSAVICTMLLKSTQARD